MEKVFHQETKGSNARRGTLPSRPVVMMVMPRSENLLGRNLNLSCEGLGFKWTPEIRPLSETDKRNGNGQRCHFYSAICTIKFLHSISNFINVYFAPETGPVIPSRIMKRTSSIDDLPPSQDFHCRRLAIHLTVINYDSDQFQSMQLQLQVGEGGEIRQWRTDTTQNWSVKKKSNVSAVGD